MQHPTGFAISQTTGRVKLVDFGAVITNPQLWVEFPHVIFGAFTTAGFAVAGMAAWRLLKKDHVDFYKKSLKVGLVVGTIASACAIGFGDLQTQFIIKDQPMKFAATEGIYKDTSDPAPWTLVELINTKDHTTSGNIEVPYLLSLLSYHKMNGSVKGMETANKSLKPSMAKIRIIMYRLRPCFGAFGSWLVAAFCSSCWVS